MSNTHISTARVAPQHDQSASREPVKLALARDGDGGEPQARSSATARDRTGRIGCPVEVDHYIVPGTGGHGRARADGLLAVAEVFGCRTAVFGYDATRKDKFLVMTATRPALDALKMLLPSIARQMEQAARAAAKAYAIEVRNALPQMNGAQRRRVLVTPYFRSFLRGYGLAVAENIRALRAEMIKSEAVELARILASDEARIEHRFNRDFPDRQSLRKEHTGHSGGIEEGKRAGQAADLGDHYLATHDLVFAML